MLLRGSFLILFALFIDGLQAGLSLALLGVVSAGSLIPFVGAAATPVGFALGIVINMCISLTMGAGLIAALAFSGMFSMRLVTAFFEVVPGLNNLPMWTIATLLCLYKKYKEEKAAAMVAGVAVRLTVNNPADTRIPRLGRAVDGVRAPKAIASLLLFIGIALGGVAHAQVPDPVQFVVAPEIPGSNETVLIEAQGIGTFLGEANITWQRDGKIEKSGRGERTFSFTTGALGSATRVHVVITSTSMGTITRDFTFRPSIINVVWEADTYTPPFYRGKALYTAGSPLKVIAFPTVVVSGSAVAAGSLSFQWLRNGEPVQSASGLGRYIFSFDGDQLQQSEVIGVEVFWGTTKVARGGITIPITQPLVLLYNRDPLRGVLYDTALPPAIALLGKEITIQAEPYFFSRASRNNGSLSYAWTLNGEETSGPDASRGILTLRQTGEGSGNAALSVSVKNNDTERLLQEASANLQIVFGQRQSSDLFSNLSAAVANFNLLAVDWTPYLNVSAPTSQQQGTFSALPSVSGSFCTGGSCTYVPLEPLPGAPPWFGDRDSFQKLLSALFRMLIAAGALFAVVMITANGVRYMLSDVVTDKGLARKRIETSLWGLLLLITAWLILFTINPNLLKFNLNPGQVNTGVSTPASTPSGNGTAPAGRLTIKINKENCERRGGHITFTPGGDGVCQTQ